MWLLGSTWEEDMGILLLHFDEVGKGGSDGCR